MRYRCLVLDHDDTVVKSTPEIHHPSFVESMKLLRPGRTPLTLAEFMSYSFEPGFGALLTDIMGYTEEEIKIQYEIWKSHMADTIPDFYEGFVELLSEYRSNGGIVCVVSHSEKAQIDGHYRLHCGWEPDLVFGWELGEDKRKPNPYPLQEIMREYQLLPKDLLVVDDLKPGLDMARSCGVDFAAAGWSHCVPAIIDYMKEHVDYYLDNVEQLKQLVLK